MPVGLEVFTARLLIFLEQESKNILTETQVVGANLDTKGVRVIHPVGGGECGRRIFDHQM